uniref:Uncharacterized protein n=1 Tax=Arundo donax TaxID=35708 RepID=A0A0A9B5W9_ARUDO
MIHSTARPRNCSSFYDHFVWCLNFEEGSTLLWPNRSEVQNGTPQGPAPYPLLGFRCASSDQKRKATSAAATSDHLPSSGFVSASSPAAPSSGVLVLLSYQQQKILLWTKVSPAAMLRKEALCDLFVSDTELKRCSKVLDYLKGNDTVVDVDVPGCDPNERFLKPSDLARLLALAVLKWIIALHSAG